MEVMYEKACWARIRSVQLFLMIIFPVLFSGCGGGHYSDFSLQFDLGQPAYVQIPPGKSVTVRLAIGFIEGSPGDIRVSWGVPPVGVSATPNSVTFTTIEECVAMLSEDSPATIDEDFARDVAEAVAAHREPLNPPAWD
jgi:hypothetical protein